VVIDVRVRPRTRPGVERGSDGALVIRVAAAPVGGRATEEARMTLAKVLGVSRAAVRLASGPRSRSKTFLVQGLDQGAAAQRLRRFTQSGA
jgi:uncharacterized protein YggU (UPF0235/DUF167 family)